MNTGTPDELDAWVAEVMATLTRSGLDERRLPTCVYLVATLRSALLAFAGAAAWVVDAEPDWYLRTRYPLEYEHIVRATRASTTSTRRSSRPSSTPRAGSIRTRARGGGGRPHAAAARDGEGHRAARRAAREFVVADLRDPEINVRYGSWYLDHLRDRYDGDVRLALAAYHAGQGNVDAGDARARGSRSRRRGRTSTRSSASAKVYRRAYGLEPDGELASLG